MTSPEEPHTRTYSHINGPTTSLLDRLAVAELCKGWPVYRDASEWMNFQSLFSEDAYVWTTWSGPQKIKDFIEISKQGKAAGAFIMHRECGTLVELNPSTNRAVGKMKATITQRFGGPGVGYDVDCDCRFIFFCEKVLAPPPPPPPSSSVPLGSTSPAPASNPKENPRPTGEERKEVEGEKGGQGEGEGEPTWHIKYAKLIYEKDKILPIDGTSHPHFEPQELEGLPEGYSYLGAAQRRLGYEIDARLVGLRDREGLGRMYGAVEVWLEGGDVELFW